MKEITMGNGMVTQVDDADFERLNQWNWTAVRSRDNFYAGKWGQKVKGQKGNGPIVWLSQEIFGPVPQGMVIDYIDRNPLNNQRSNMRLAHKYQDSSNRGKQSGNTDRVFTSSYKGVSFAKKSSKWIMQIRVKGKRYTGQFDTEIGAAKEYDRLAKELCGEFAFLNFPEPDTRSVALASTTGH
jgi:hypothetical protein